MEDRSSLDDHLRFGAEQRRLPKHQIGHFPDFDGTDVVGDAVRDGRIDGVFRHVPLHAEIVVAVVVVRILGERAALLLHLVGRLPGAGDNLADPSHGLRVRTHHGDQPKVMKHILGPDGLGANTRIGEGDVFRHIAVKMMRDHHHVEMFIDGVTGERHGRVCGTREHVGETGRADDVGRMAAARPFGVIGVDGPALECGDGVFDAPSLIQGVRMDGHLHVHVVGDTEACVDDGRGRAPILVDLQSGRSRTNLLAQWFRR